MSNIDSTTNPETENPLQGSLEENVLAALIWSQKAGPVIRTALDIQILSSSVYRRIARKVFEYYDKYSTPPEDHVSDLIEPDIKDEAEGRLVWNLLLRLQTIHDGMNPDFVLDELDRFIEARRMKMALIEAQDLLEEGKIEEARQVVVEGAGRSGGGAPILTRKLSAVESKPVTWLWPGYLPLGTLCLVDGDPGLGKSFLTLDVAARVSAGKEFPTGDRTTPAGVILLSFEDDPGVTIRPRLERMGADLDRIVLLEGITDKKGGNRLPSLADTSAILEAANTVNARLVVIDPLMAALPAAVDSFSDQSVRTVLAPLGKLAQEMGATVIVVRHLNKSRGGNALYRGGGSIGIIAAARAAFLIGKDPQDAQTRVLAAAKMNLAASPPSLRFRIIGSPGEPPVLEWLPGPCGLSAGDLLEPPPRGTVRESAEDFLRERLRDGPVDVDVVEREARERGISSRTLCRAREALGIKTRKVSFDGGWSWRLPDTPEEGEDPPAEVANAKMPPPLKMMAPSEKSAPVLALSEGATKKDGIFGETRASSSSLRRRHVPKAGLASSREGPTPEEVERIFDEYERLYVRTIEDVKRYEETEREERAWRRRQDFLELARARNRRHPR